MSQRRDKTIQNIICWPRIIGNNALISDMWDQSSLKEKQYCSNEQFAQWTTFAVVFPGDGSHLISKLYGKPVAHKEKSCVLMESIFPSPITGIFLVLLYQSYTTDRMPSSISLVQNLVNAFVDTWRVSSFKPGLRGFKPTRNSTVTPSVATPGVNSDVTHPDLPLPPHLHFLTPCLVEQLILLKINNPTKTIWSGARDYEPGACWE